MKKVLILLGILSVSTVAATAQSQKSCRDISAGGFIQPDEVIMQTDQGYVACRIVKPDATATKVEKAPVPTPDPAPTPIPSARAPLAVQPLSNHEEWKAPIVQVAAGYQYNSVNFSGNVSDITFSTTRLNTNGVFAQVMVNFNRYVSAVGNVDASYKSYEGSNYLLTYVTGVQAYPVRHGKWSPFGRFMVGAGTLHVSGLGTDTGFAWQVGGGLDWKPMREGRMTFRLSTFDFARVSKDGINANSLKIGTGIVF
jgi:hypothetical protein